MKIRVRVKYKVGLAIAAGVALLLAFLPAGDQAEAQVGIGINPPGRVSGDGAYWTSDGPLQTPQLPPQGTWAEVINATNRWLVIQNQAGQQFPIAADRVRQFLVRWPSGTDQVTEASVIEVTGPEAGSNTVLADHIDIYEADAQNLVSPTVQNLYGFNRTLSAFDVDQQNTYGTVYWMTPEEYAIPSRMHVVGRAAGNTPVQIQINGNNVITVQPSTNGMSVTQVTLGSNSFAKRGDLIYVIPSGSNYRSLDVSSLVLYKKVPLRQFQP